MSAGRLVVAVAAVGLIAGCAFVGTVVCSSGFSTDEVTTYEGRTVGEPTVTRLPNGDLQVLGEFTEIRQRRIPPGQEYQEYSVGIGSRF